MSRAFVILKQKHNRAAAKVKKKTSMKAPSGKKARAEATLQTRRGAPGAQKKTCFPMAAERSRPEAPAKAGKKQAANAQRKENEQHHSRLGPPQTKTAKKPAIPEQRKPGHWPTPNPEKRLTTMGTGSR